MTATDWTLTTPWIVLVAVLVIGFMVGLYFIRQERLEIRNREGKFGDARIRGSMTIATGHPTLTLGWATKEAPGVVGLSERLFDEGRLLATIDVQAEALEAEFRRARIATGLMGTTFDLVLMGERGRLFPACRVYGGDSGGRLHLRAEWTDPELRARFLRQKYGPAGIERMNDVREFLANHRDDDPESP